MFQKIIKKIRNRNKEKVGYGEVENSEQLDEPKNDNNVLDLVKNS